MRWHDVAIVINTTKFSESSFVVTMLTKNHGIHKGLLKGREAFASDLVTVTWTARLQDHLGVWSFDLINSNISFFIKNKAKLSTVIVLFELLRTILTERTPCTEIFDRTLDFFEQLKLKNLNWINYYLLLEAFILEKNGYGFDFDEVKDLTEPFYFVSPKTGKVVSQSRGELYKNKLLICPAFIAPKQYTHSVPSWSDINDAFTLINYFLRKAIPEHMDFLYQERSLMFERIRDLFLK
jgi:DNA repair protein RecO (recombination protein O)